MSRATCIHYDGEERTYLCDRHAKASARLQKNERRRRGFWDHTYAFAGREECMDCAASARTEQGMAGGKPGDRERDPRPCAPSASPASEETQ